MEIVVQKFFDQLQQETQTERENMLQINQLQLAARGEIALESYIAYLSEAYHHVKHTLPLLMACGARIPSSKEWLRQALAEYISEEMGHQQWILNDITACGGDADAVRLGRPGAATELMVSYAYDSIQRGNPVAFFGMVLVLEGTSTTLASQAAAAIQSALQLPRTAFSYLYSHGALDIEHMQFFAGLMNRLDEPADQQAVIHMANMMYRLYGDIFRSIPL